MNSKTTLLIIFFTISFLTCKAQVWKTYPYTPVGSLISFSADEGHHTAESIEWWYTMGHVTGATTGINYSYMLSYFYYPYLGFQGFRILNITNDDTGQKVFVTQPVNYSNLTTDRINIEASSFSLPKTEHWRNKKENDGTLIPFEYEILAASSTTEIDLEYITVKRPLILGDDGKFDQGATSFTYYYSQTKNDVTGSITFNGITESITGTGWIDRQYGSFNPLVNEKYEWFSMQLSNGMDINLWNIFTPDNKIPDNEKYKILSAYVDENTQYTSDDFNIERLEFDCTSDELRCYSQKWRLTSSTNNLDLTISVLHDDSEVQLPFRFYEGATSVEGTVNDVAVTGQGFAELLHSYENPDITLTNPIDGTFHSSENISWDINNPDDGNPLLYDIEYSIDNKQSFQIIEQGISDNFYHWENPNIATGENIWFRITTYSIDKTLSGIETSSSSSSFTLPVESFNKKSIEIYPNPTNYNLQVNLNEVIPILNYQIIDLNGRVLIEKKTNNSSDLTIDIRNFESGLYFLKLSNENKTLQSKIIVK